MADDETMKGARTGWSVPPSIKHERSAVAIDVVLGLADLPLGFSFHLLRLPLQLLARVTGQSAGRVAQLTTDFLRRTLGLVLEAIRAEIVCHGSTSGISRKDVRMGGCKASDVPVSQALSERCRYLRALPFDV